MCQGGLETATEFRGSHPANRKRTRLWLMAWPILREAEMKFPYSGKEAGARFYMYLGECSWGGAGRVVVPGMYRFREDPCP